MSYNLLTTLMVGTGSSLSGRRCSKHLIGALGVQGKRPEAVPGAKDPVLGDILVVIAQVAAALQFIIEEKYLAQYRSARQMCRIKLAACAPDARTAPPPCLLRAQRRTLAHPTHACAVF